MQPEKCSCLARGKGRLTVHGAAGVRSSVPAASADDVPGFCHASRDRQSARRRTEGSQAHTMRERRSRATQCLVTTSERRSGAGLPLASERKGE
jgi:hypothetical protein